jgi:signal peptidase II
MQRASSLKLWSFFLTALGVVLADQLSKFGIRSNLLVGQSLFEVGFFQITRVPPNTGAAFGLFQDHSFALTIVAIIVAGLLLLYAFIIRRQLLPLGGRLAGIALGLVLGGTIGNLVDRLLFGGVTDFISVGWWPAFNIADSSVVVGVILFAYSLLRLARKHG